MRYIKLVAILIFVGIGLGVYLKFGFGRQASDDLISPLVVPTARPESTPSPTVVPKRSVDNVVKKLEQAIAGYTGTYGVYVRSLVDGTEYGVRQDEVFPAASQLKLPVMLAALVEVEKGSLRLDETYTLQDKDKIEWTTLGAAQTGSVWKYGKLLELMGKTSDNSAQQIVIRRLGMDKVQDAIEIAGMRKTTFTRDETTPRDVGEFFRRLYEGGLLQTENNEQIFAFLTDTIFEDRIPAGIPDEVRVAHKVGTEDRGYSDAGVIFGKKPFVLVVMSRGADVKEAPKAMAKVAKIVWEFEEEGRE
jgi:beta-lactamase class A